MKPNYQPLIAALQQADPGLASTANGLLLLAEGGALSLAGLALLRALEDQQVLQQAGAEVSAVADILRRDQKFSPPGRPSLHLVQLRRQQATVQQAERVARQAAAASASAFVKQAQLPLKPGMAAGEALARWLRQWSV